MEAECRVVWLPVWCGRYVEAVLCVGVSVRMMVCGAMGLCHFCVCVFGLWCGQSWVEQHRR